MKRKITFRSLVQSFSVAILSAVGICSAFALPVLPIVIAIFSISFVPTGGGAVYATVYKEVWTGAVKNQMSTSEVATFLDGIEDFSRYVSQVGDEAEAIHIAYMGVDPEVLINNTTYPIPIVDLPIEDIVVSLDKFQTKATPITDDELYALSVDKIGNVKTKHGKSILKTKFKKAIHAVAPSGNTAAMPVLLTTGADDGTGRKRLVWADLVRLKKECDDLEIPSEGRRLVLCPDHENDMLLLDTKFKDQYYNAASGKPYNTLGFEFYSYVNNPYYRPSTKAKLAFGAVPLATDRRASVFFSLERVAKAQGSTKMYYSTASTDPQYQRNLVNFRHYYIVMPTREEGRGAIVSDNV